MCARLKKKPRTGYLKKPGINSGESPQQCCVSVRFPEVFSFVSYQTTVTSACVAPPPLVRLNAHHLQVASTSATWSLLSHQRWSNRREPVDALLMCYCSFIHPLMSTFKRQRALQMWYYLVASFYL